MIRAAVFLTAASLAAAGTTTCALNGARAVDDLLDSATYIWATVQRCGKDPSENAILCSMDVASSIESINAMVNVILKGINQCGELEGENVECGLSVGTLTKTFAGVAAASSGLTAKCPNALNGGKGLTFLVSKPKVNDPQGTGALASAAQEASFARCIVDVGDLTKTIFKAAHRIVTVKDSCDGESKEHCAHNSLKIVAAFAAMGEYLAGAVGRCAPDNVADEKMKRDTECTDKVMELVGELDRMSAAGLAMGKKCEIGASRLFELEHGEQTSKGSPITFALMAFLPLTAVFGFAIGKRFGKSQEPLAPAE